METMQRVEQLKTANGEEKLVRGWVKFRGTLPEQKGVYLGVEWDDPACGKHSGDLKGTKFFECTVPGSGSFVKEATATVGRCVTEAIAERYGVAGNVETVMGGLSITTTKGALAVDFVGQDKAARNFGTMSLLDKLNVANEHVSHVAARSQLTAAAPNAREIDLANNLLCQWRDVVDIVACCPRLESIVLSGNRFHPLVPPLPFDESFQRIRRLVLNNAVFAWDEVTIVARALPHLEELHLSKNGIARIGEAIDPNDFAALQTLDLSFNEIADWGEIAKLGSLPRLENIFLQYNPFDTIFYPGGDAEAPFPALKSLSLSYTRLREWASIDALSAFPAVTSLRLTNVPLFEGITAEVARQIIISRMPKLTHLNGGSQINIRERETAERFFLRHFAGSDAMRAVPRYRELEERHGTQVPAAAAKPRSANVALRTLDGAEKKRKLPLSTEVSKLGPMLGLSGGIVGHHLYYTHADVTYPLDDGLRTLSYYSVQDGGTIFVSDVALQVGAHVAHEP